MMAHNRNQPHTQCEGEIYENKRVQHRKRLEKRYEQSQKTVTATLRAITTQRMNQMMATKE